VVLSSSANQGLPAGASLLVVPLGIVGLDARQGISGGDESSLAPIRPMGIVVS
jgi:hypothetical protein